MALDASCIMGIVMMRDLNQAFTQQQWVGRLKGMIDKKVWSQKRLGPLSQQFVSHFWNWENPMDSKYCRPSMSILAKNTMCSQVVASTHQCEYIIWLGWYFAVGSL